MKQYSIQDIRTLAATQQNKNLRLHWEGDEAEPAKTTPVQILDDLLDEDYSEQDFDSIGYCVSEEDYQEEQSQGK